MCRLALFNRDFLLSSGSDLLSHFWNLEMAMGGDGNGVAVLFEDGSHAIEKGLDFNPTDAHDQIEKWATMGGEWFLFHTRLATSGGKSDRMCHPFEENGYVLAHNGVCSGYAGFSIHGKEVSDTRFLLHVATTYHNNPFKMLYDASGVFIGFKLDDDTGKSMPFAIKSTAHSDLKVLLSEKDLGVCFTSVWNEPVPEDYQMWGTIMQKWTSGNVFDIKKMLAGRQYSPDLKKYISSKEYVQLGELEQKQYTFVTGTNKRGKTYGYYMKQVYHATSWSGGYYNEYTPATTIPYTGVTKTDTLHLPAIKTEQEENTVE